VITLLNEITVRTVAERLRACGIRSLAIGFLNSYSNPAHEEQAAQLVAEVHPEVAIATSHRVTPKIGALGRFVTTIVSAALRPVAGDYVDRLSGRLAEQGFQGTLWFVISNGGMMLADEVRHRPETMFVSGPAAGAEGALQVGRLLGLDHLITLDMGGTSCDVTLIEGGRLSVTSDYEIDFDMPLTIPTIDIRTIGAGGGSIAWIDRGGSLEVGPQSAGADPGPACYGRGGTEATVTDADLLLGYIDPDRFLGGEMRLDIAAAERAVGTLGQQLGLSTTDTAAGIVRVVNEHMAAAIREVSIDRGRDPRDYTLLPFGGAGPVHAVALAEIIGIPRVVVPPEPEVLSSFGAIALDVKIDVETTSYSELRDVDTDQLEGQFRTLETQGRDLLVQQGVNPDDIIILRVAELRYVGQTYELPVDAPADLTANGALQALEAAFHREHENFYGVSDPESPVAIVNLRVTAIGRTAKPSFLPARPQGRAMPFAKRTVYFPRIGHVKVPIYWRADLPAGVEIRGPAIIEQRGSTFVIPDGWVVMVDVSGNLLAERGKG
jgi:N-methylhydantoinase A